MSGVFAAGRSAPTIKYRQGLVTRAGMGLHGPRSGGERFLAEVATTFRQDTSSAAWLWGRVKGRRITFALNGICWDKIGLFQQKTRQLSVIRP